MFGHKNSKIITQLKICRDMLTAQNNFMYEITKTERMNDDNFKKFREEMNKGLMREVNRIDQIIIISNKIHNAIEESLKDIEERI